MDTLQRVLSSYNQIFTDLLRTLSKTSTTDVHAILRHFLLYAPLAPILLTFHTLFAALSIHRLTQGKQFWLKSLVLTTFAAFGGSTLAAVFSAQPAPLFTTASNLMLSYITIAWYISNHTPLLHLLSFRPITAVIAFGAMAAKSRAIFNFIDNYTPRFPGQVAGAIILGGLSGSGGALFVSLEKFFTQGFSAHSEFSAPGWGLKSAYMAATSYYIATDPDFVLRALPISLKYVVRRDDARFYIALALCSHAAIETLYGRHINPVWWLERVFFAVTSVRKETVVEDIPSTELQTDVGEKVKQAWADGVPQGIRKRPKAE